MIKVVNIADITSVDIFKDKELQLGDQKGNWYVYDEGLDVVYGRYIDKTTADYHAESLNDTSPKEPGPYDGLSAEELAKEVEELIKDL